MAVETVTHTVADIIEEILLVPFHSPFVYTMPSPSPDVLDCSSLCLPTCQESCCLECHEEGLLLGRMRFRVRLTSGDVAQVCCLCYRALKQQGLVAVELYC